jgi:homocysteine S-methyltransferase
MFQTNGKQFDLILGEGSMYERLRRVGDINFDPHIAYASLIYDDKSRSVLEQVHREYLDIGQHFGLPMIATTPTWRANTERISKSNYAGLSVNRDCARFMLELRKSYGQKAHPILIGGNCGPKGDGYLPDEAPSTEEAEEFHSLQITELANSGVDFLIAKTLPSFGEALGIARIMAQTKLPYVISFVARRDGTLLDGTPLDEAVQRIDSEVRRAPATYYLNCVHASIFTSALKATKERNSMAAARITGLDANTSAKDPDELDGLEEIDTEAPFDFGNNLWSVHQAFGTVYLGGCCGSSTEHIEALARQATSAQ